MTGQRRSAGWFVSVYPEAGEAGGSFRPSVPTNPKPVRPGQGRDPDRAREEASRRARAKLRRYCAANLLNRFGTLTYGPPRATDPLVVRDHMAVFWRRLRASLGGDPMPYAWVPEWHADGVHLHAHFAVGQFVPRGLIDAAWGHGFIKIKLFGDLPVGTTVREHARVAGRYMAKYASKTFGGQGAPGLHRYEVAQGFQPAVTTVTGATGREALRQACDIMGGPPDRVWDSGDNEDWSGPPAVWASWR